jgi:hypothetical protein
MKKQAYVLAAATAILLTGCVVTSVHPYYTAKDLVFEPSLVGQWTKTQSDEFWTFQKEGNDSYNLTYVSGGKTNLARAHLFKLNGQMFLDFVSLDPECEVFGGLADGKWKVVCDESGMSTVGFLILCQLNRGLTFFCSDYEHMGPL